MDRVTSKSENKSEDLDRFINQAIGDKFVQVLENAGVFKMDVDGKQGMIDFFESVKRIYRMKQNDNAFSIYVLENENNRIELSDLGATLVSWKTKKAMALGKRSF